MANGGFLYLVLRHEQPARESAVYFVEPIAAGELAKKRGAVLHVAQDQPRYAPPGHELFLKEFEVDSARRRGAQRSCSPAARHHLQRQRKHARNRQRPFSE